MRAAGALLLACVAGCGAGATSPAPDSGGRFDAGCCTEGGADGGLAPGCGALELGRCLVDATGDDCSGRPDEAGRFVPMPPGTPFFVVVGPQGSSMIVLAARAAGIDPGDPDRPSNPENPETRIVLMDEAVELALYRGRSAYWPDPDAPDTYVNSGLFIVVDDIRERLFGRDLIALGTLRDSAGAERCGRLLLRAER